MTRRVVIALSLIASLALGLAVDASARYRTTPLHPQPKRLRIRKASAPAPAITSVTPLKPNVGEKLTIVGKNFLVGKDRNKVFFLRQGGGVISAKAGYATKTRIVVTIPDTLTPLLRSTGRTRFQIRILTTLYGDPTKLSSSPLIGRAAAGGGGGPVPVNAPTGDCDHDKILNKDETDDDNDLIPDQTEATYTATDPCNPDTDGDKVTDGYEWQSAKDLNNTTPYNTPDAARPYPGKKPWPNPLDKTDTGIDHDGDGLSMMDEYLLFKYYGHNTLPLNYSDGLQASRQVAVPTAPELAYMDMHDDGVLSDDERDEDRDGIGNWDELYGRLTPGYWKAKYDGQNGNPMEKPYPDVMQENAELVWNTLSHVDPDTDGDGIKDGADDQDFDGLSNMFEIERPAGWGWTYVSVGPSFAHTGVLTDEQQAIVEDYNLTARFPVVAPNPWARVNPFNPCKPVWSKTCHVHWPFGYYPPVDDWMGPNPQDYNPPPVAPWLYQGEN